VGIAKSTPTILVVCPMLRGGLLVSQVISTKAENPVIATE
jgi:hypothetical protein